MAWGRDDRGGRAQTARVTAHATFPAPRMTPPGMRKAATRIAIATLGAAALVVAGLALHAAGTADQGSTMTVAELDRSLSVTPAGSRTFDRAPSSVLENALDREAGDAAVVRASGMPIGSQQRLGVTFTAADRAAAERLAGLLSDTTGFTVAVAPPAHGQPQWSVGGITPRAPLTVPVAHQLTERMSEAAWAGGHVRFGGWRVVTR